MKRRQAISIFALLFMLIGLVACSTSAETLPDQSISPTDFKRLLERHQGDPDVVLLDIRTPREFKAGYIEGARLLDYYSSDFVDRLKTLDRDKTYLVYCRSGNRSGRSLAIFNQLGFQQTFHLETGIRGWSQERYPVVQ